MTDKNETKDVAKEVPQAPQKNVTGEQKTEDGIVMQGVSSTQIVAIGHKDTTMVVEFTNGDKYQYEGVDAERFKSILRAESVGKAFNTLVKANPQMFPFTKLGKS